MTYYMSDYISVSITISGIFDPLLTPISKKIVAW